MQGYGPTQIARILTERGIDTPTVHNRKCGLPATSLKMEFPNIWNTEAVIHILENMNYCGHTVNFTTKKKSYKSKKKIRLPREDWVIFKDTHEALIEEDMRLVKRYTEITELTPEVVREFIEKVIVHQAEKVNGKKYQAVEIIYNCVGVIPNPTQE